MGAGALLGNRRSGGGEIVAGAIFKMNFWEPETETIEGTEETVFYDKVEGGKCINYGATQSNGGLYFDGVDDYLKFDPMTIKNPSGGFPANEGSWCFWFQKENASDILTLMDASEGDSMRSLKCQIRGNTIWFREGNGGTFGGNRRDLETGAIPEINSTDLQYIVIQPIDMDNIRVILNGVEYMATYAVGEWTSEIVILDTWYFHFMNNRNDYGTASVAPTFSKGWLYQFMQYDFFLTNEQIMQNIDNKEF